MTDTQGEPTRRRVLILRAGIEFPVSVAADNSVMCQEGAWRPRVGQTLWLQADHARQLVQHGGASFAQEEAVC